MNKKIISLLLAIYILYMFQFFKTTVSLNHPLEMIFTNKLNKINNTNQFTHSSENKYESKICPFGHKIIWLLIIFLTIRYFINIPKKINLAIMIIVCLFSLLNLNAFIYLLPYYIIEIKYFI